MTTILQIMAGALLPVAIIAVAVVLADSYGKAWRLWRALSRELEQ